MNAAKPNFAPATARPSERQALETKAADLGDSGDTEDQRRGIGHTALFECVAAERYWSGSFAVGIGMLVISGSKSEPRPAGLQSSNTAVACFVHGRRAAAANLSIGTAHARRCSRRLSRTAGAR